MSEARVESVVDAGGPAWEKRGNAVWLRCPGCGAWFPAATAMLAADAPPCTCPGCHLEFRPSGRSSSAAG